MKRKLLSLSLVILSVFGLNAQVNTIIGLPTPNNSTQLRAPNGTASHTSMRGHMIIEASEITGLTTGDIITSIGFALADGIGGSASGNIQFYLENTTDATNLKSTTWATAIGTMLSVYNGAVTLPATPPNTPVNIDLPTTTNFIYTGGGIYVAYDYSANTGGFATFPATYFASTTIPGGVVMDSTSSTIPPAVLGLSSAFRPVIRFGKANPNANDMSVFGVRPVLGTVNKAFSSTTGATGYVANLSNTTLTNVDVTLTVTGANPYTTIETIPTIDAGAAAIVDFTGVPTAVSGTNTYVVTVAADDDNTNNSSSTMDQIVTCDYESFAPIVTPVAGNGLGFQTAGTSAILAIGLDVPTSTAPVFIPKMETTFSDDVSMIGQQIKGVLLNSANVIVDSTAIYTIAAGDVTQTVELSFLNGSVDYSGQSMYVGYRLIGSQTAFFPMGSVPEEIPNLNTYYVIGPNGGTPNPQNGALAFLLKANLSFGDVTVTSDAFNGNICAGNLLTLTATPTAGLDVYDFNVGGSSVQATNSSTYSYVPTAATTFFVEGSLNGCTSTSASETVTPISQFTSSFNDDICSGNSYTFGTQTLTTTGSYSETFTSLGGCDSVVTLNLVVVDIDPTVTASGATLTATYSGTGTTYQWVDCDNGDAPIAGATSASFTPTAQTNGVVGNYAVVINQASCTDQSTCFLVDFTGITESSDSKLTVYPSPALDVLNISSDLNEVRSYTVYDLEGRIVLRNTVVNSQSLNQIDINNLSSGTYLLELISDDASARKMFVKQ